MSYGSNRTTLQACSAYDLPSVAALIRYFHAAAGYPVRSAWLKAIGSGNYYTWPGLTLANATEYFPNATATLLGHLVQKRQGVRSPKMKAPTIFATATTHTPPGQVKKTPRVRYPNQKVIH